MLSTGTPWWRERRVTHQQIQIRRVRLDVVSVVGFHFEEVFELRRGFRSQRVYERGHPPNAGRHALPRQA